MNEPSNNRSLAVIVTGSGGGIGRALCKNLKEAGYIVVGLDLKGSNCQADISIDVDFRRILEKSDGIEDIVSRTRCAVNESECKIYSLINNAAVQKLGTISELSCSDWSESVAVNITTPYLLSKFLMPDLAASGGSIVNVASIHAILTKPGFSIYATTKAALVGLTKSLAVEIGSQVRVNAVLPAAIETDMLIAGFEGNESGLKKLAEHHPTKNIGTVEEVAEVCKFLISSNGRFINGSIWGIDGGIASRLHDPA